MASFIISTDIGICSLDWTWGQFHFVYSNSTEFHLVSSNLLILILFLLTLIAYYFLPWVGTPSIYLEYLLQVVYIPSSIFMEEIFLN